MRYIKYLRIVNFQSHEDTTIEFDPGLNILVGESDQGKTAVIRALRWLFYNEPRGSGFIRVGESYCEVTATLSDEVKVSRIRDDSRKINRYVIACPGKEEIVFEKFKNEVPLEVQKQLGIFRLLIDKDHNLEVNLARQLENPFLLNETASNRAKVIGRIANLHIIDAAHRDVLRDIRGLSKTKNDLEDEVFKLEEQIKQYDDLARIETQLLRGKHIIDKLEELTAFITKLEDLRFRIESIKEKLKENEVRLDQLEKVNQVQEKYLKFREVFNHHNQLQDLYAGINKREQEICFYTEKLNKLAHVGRTEDISKNINQIYTSLKQMQNLQVKHNEVKNSLEKLNALLDFTSNLEKGEKLLKKLYDMRQQGFDLQQLKKTANQIYNSISEKQERLDKVSDYLKKTSGLSAVEEINTTLVLSADRYNTLVEMQKHYEGILAEYNNNLYKLKNAEDLYENLVEEYITVLGTAEKCPTCGSEITREVISKIEDSMKI